MFGKTCATAALGLGLGLGLAMAGPAAAVPDVARGELLFHVGGCGNCHTDTPNQGAAFAGGRALETPFGTFRTPNISPDPEHGIGRWSDADFLKAMREGVSPGGSPYYPAFPYVAYTGMTDDDILSIKAYIDTLEPVAEPSPPHALGFPFNQRWGMWLWRWLNFEPGPFEPDPGKSEAWNRGRYLAEAVAHCGECHTPRGFDGSLDRDRWMAGTRDGPEGDMAPNITPHAGTGIGAWSDGDLDFVLSDGLTVDGDVVGSVMYDVVEDGTSRLSADDRKAIIAYLRDLPPIENQEAKAKQP